MFLRGVRPLKSSDREDRYLVGEASSFLISGFLEERPPGQQACWDSAPPPSLGPLKCSDPRVARLAGQVYFCRACGFEK